MIVITGAAGHLGNTLMRLLLSQGEEVRAFIRETTSRQPLAGLDIDVFLGDLSDPGSLVRAFSGADMVYHCAAYISILPGQTVPLYETNVKGTENVINACIKTGIRRLVFISSIEALDWHTGRGQVNETSGYHPENTLLEYGRTKAEASLLVLSAVEEGLDVVITIPTGITGPYDFKISEMGSLVLDYASGRLPVYVDGGFDFVDVRDVAAGTIEAGKRGRTGESYLLSGTYVTVSAIMEILEEVTGRKKPGFKVPYRLAMFGARFSERRALRRGTVPKFTRDSLRILKEGLSADSSKAERELGYHPRDIRESFHDAYRWFKKEGYIDESASGRR